MIFRKSLILLMLAIPGGCNVDRLHVVTFEVYNQHDKDVRVEFTQYKVPWTGGITDTAFLVTPGDTRVVYIQDGLAVPPKESYINSGRAVFCDGAKLSSEQQESSRDLLSENEWGHKRIDRYKEVYTLTVITEDF